MKEQSHFPYRCSLPMYGINTRTVHQLLSRRFGKSGDRWFAMSDVEFKVVELFAPRKLHLYFRDEKDAAVVEMLFGVGQSHSEIQTSSERPLGRARLEHQKAGW